MLRFVRIYAFYKVSIELCMNARISKTMIQCICKYARKLHFLLWISNYAAGERIEGIFRVCQKPANLCHPAEQCILMGEGVYTNT